MTRRLALLALACLHAQAADPPPAGESFQVNDDWKRWGSPEKILPPEYPSSALKRGVAASVDIEGTVLPTRQLSDVRYTSESPEKEPFIEALKEVLPYWTFHPVKGDDCWPQPQRVTTTVWFEVAEGKPKISVSSAKLPASVRREVMKPIQRRAPAYPAAMIRAEKEAIVYARMEVNRDGNVVDVQTQIFATPGSESRAGLGETIFPHPKSGPETFSGATTYALSQWKFPPLPEGESKSRFACLEVVYHLTN